MRALWDRSHGTPQKWTWKWNPLEVNTEVDPQKWTWKWDPQRWTQKWTPQKWTWIWTPWMDQLGHPPGWTSRGTPHGWTSWGTPPRGWTNWDFLSASGRWAFNWKADLFSDKFQQLRVPMLMAARLSTVKELWIMWSV